MPQITHFFQFYMSILTQCRVEDYTRKRAMSSKKALTWMNGRIRNSIIESCDVCLWKNKVNL
ncbi:protein of unknown function [Paenibacillus alvei]|uniref:Uncharacterized protein n=1 Tax=Paenibacillus alvei TaxID=44250 RepID=A0A383RFM3_PAEAL|nr:protein of unknown function [Paenibacillus alvei]